jgi:hypothetical protein
MTNEISQKFGLYLPTFGVMHTFPNVLLATIIVAFLLYSFLLHALAYGTLFHGFFLCFSDYSHKFQPGPRRPN